ncbi:MAG TPA: hypothetical protein VGB67_12720, partial [Fibrella sp.]
QIKDLFASIGKALANTEFLYTETTASVDVYRYGLVAVNNTTAGNVDITISGATPVTVGMKVTIYRYSDQSTGPVTIRCNTGSFLQNSAGVFVSAINLPLTDGQRQLTFQQQAQGYWVPVGATIPLTGSPVAPGGNVLPAILPMQLA